jgi:hypothetical protein
MGAESTAKQLAKAIETSKPFTDSGEKHNWSGDTGRYIPKVEKSDNKDEENKNNCAKSGNTLKSFLKNLDLSRLLPRNKKIEQVDYSKDEVDKTIGASTRNASECGHYAISFTFPKHAHDKLKALASDREEKIATTARKIIEHKVPTSPVVINDAQRIKVTVKLSEQLRAQIDQLIEGTGMKRTDFLSLQLESFFDDITEPDPAP